MPLTYKDMTFCNNPQCICSRKITQEVIDGAKQAGLGIAQANLCGHLTLCNPIYDSIEERPQSSLRPGWYITGSKEDNPKAILSGPYIQHASAEIDLQQFMLNYGNCCIVNEDGVSLEEIEEIKALCLVDDAMINICKDLRNIINGIDPITGNQYPDQPHNVTGCLQDYIDMIESSRK